MTYFHHILYRLQKMSQTVHFFFAKMHILKIDLIEYFFLATNIDKQTFPRTNATCILKYYFLHEITIVMIRNTMADRIVYSS